MLLCFVYFLVFDALSASRNRQDIKRLNANAMVRRKNIDEGEHVIANEPTSIEEPRNARARESNRREKKVHRHARWCDANELFKQKQAPLCAPTRRRRRIAPVDALRRGDSGTGAKKQRTGETEPHERCRTSRRRWRRRRRRRFAVQRSGVPTSSREPENFRHLYDATRNRTPLPFPLLQTESQQNSATSPRVLLSAEVKAVFRARHSEAGGRASPQRFLCSSPQTAMPVHEHGAIIRLVRPICGWNLSRRRSKFKADCCLLH